MVANPGLSASLEDYLEAILHVVTEKHVARVKDISRRLNVNYSSVSGALRTLAKKNLVNYSPYEVVTLTPEGRAKAEEVVRRHETLKTFFSDVLKLEDAVADETACKLEHIVSPEVMDRFSRLVQFVEASSESELQWLKQFHRECTTPSRPRRRKKSVRSANKDHRSEADTEKGR